MLGFISTLIRQLNFHLLDRHYRRNGATRIILGSHHEGAVFRSKLKPTTVNGESVLDCHSPFGESQYSLDDLVDLGAPAGTLFIFNTDCWHASGELNKQGLERKFVVCHNRG